jgi:hypothetical protein
LDDVNIFLANKKSRHNTTICMNHNHPPRMAQEWRELDYWDSGEAIKLFNPAPGKLVKQCLVTETNCYRTLLKMLTRLRR